MAAFTTSEWRLARQLYASNDDVSLWQILLMARMWIWLSSVQLRPMPCFGNIMRVSVIFVGKKLGLAIILSSGSVLSVPQSMSAADFQRYQQALKCRKCICCFKTRVSSQNHFVTT